MLTNPNLLVLCLDTATGFARVGWAADLPPGRFIHLDIIVESGDCHPLTSNSPHYAHYQQACERARQLNLPALDKQIAFNQQQGWFRVPLTEETPAACTSDDFGCYLDAATHSLYRMTANVLEVWAVVDGSSISHIQSRHASPAYTELEYQVWRHHTLSKLKTHPGKILSGRLRVQESGLWFVAEVDEA